MNKEQQLEQVARTIEEYEVSKAPPIFELFACLVAISIFILLVMLQGVFNQDDTFYILMRAVLPQNGWAAAFFLSGVLSAVGMLINSGFTRILSLVVMTALYGIVATFYIMTFPNLAGVLMFWIAIFTAASVPMVKYTGLRK